MLIKNSTLLHRIVVEQIFVAVALFTFFPVAALLEDRKALELSLQKSEQLYRELANADSLTGLPNRRAFDERLDEEWQRALRIQNCLALVAIDVDLFKCYNDLYGHIGGDECLRFIGTAIARATSSGSAFAARIGGEEFAVILPGARLDQALLVAEEIRSVVAAAGLSNSGSPHLIQTISAGVAAAVPKQDQTSMSLLAAADHALYRAKYLGRNRVESESAASLVTESTG